MNGSDSIPRHKRHYTRPPRLLVREWLAILGYVAWVVLMIAPFAAWWGDVRRERPRLAQALVVDPSDGRRASNAPSLSTEWGFALSAKLSDIGVAGEDRDQAPLGTGPITRFGP